MSYAYVLIWINTYFRTLPLTPHPPPHFSLAPHLQPNGKPQISAEGWRGGNSENKKEKEFKDEYASQCIDIRGEQPHQKKQNKKTNTKPLTTNASLTHFFHLFLQRNLPPYQLQNHSPLPPPITPLFVHPVHASAHPSPALAIVASA